jgi:UDPglucose 6-dehydrogenase
VKIAVAGLWHLGTVISACLASAGHEVIAFDENVDDLRNGKPPLYEPGLEELLASTSIAFTSDRNALRDAELVWIAYDTPVDEDDHADVNFVLDRVASLFDVLADGTLIVVSSQLPVGSVRRLEQMCSRLSFACSPENLRLGKAIESFMKPARVVAGVRTERDRETFARAMQPIATNIEWMSVESAEMSKHALNAFLATSVAFINEIAVVCESVGADAKEVERALKSDPRIGPRAYLSPGGAFAGGTLARDVSYLSSMRTLPLIDGVRASNDAHQQWPQQKLQSVLGDLRGRTIAVWGLTYKPGTDTLRRSSAVELCRWLWQSGARVRAHDPAVKSLPAELSFIELQTSAEDAVRGAEAVVIATEWPEYRDAPLPANIVVIDANRFVAIRDGIRYYTVGKGTP